MNVSTEITSDESSATPGITIPISVRNDLQRRSTNTQRSSGTPSSLAMSSITRSTEYMRCNHNHENSKCNARDKVLIEAYAKTDLYREIKFVTQLMYKNPEERFAKKISKDLKYDELPNWESRWVSIRDIRKQSLAKRRAQDASGMKKKFMGKT